MELDEADHRLSDFFQLLGNGVRLAMAKHLLKEKHYVQELADKLDHSIKSVSDHLRHFRDLDIVESETEENRRYYWIKRPELVKEALELREHFKRN